MQDQEFHDYVKQIASLMPGWEYRESANAYTTEGCGQFEGQTFRELRPCPKIHYRSTSAAIWFERDDHRKKLTAHVERNRQIGNRNESLADSFKASAGFSQGRPAEQIARTILTKVADAAIKAGEELDKRVAQAAESRAGMLATIAKLNASKLLTSALAKPREHDSTVYFHGKGSSGYVNAYGGVRLERVDVDAATAVRIMAILAERGE